MSKTIIDVKHFEFRWSRITRNCCNAKIELYRFSERDTVEDIVDAEAFCEYNLHVFTFNTMVTGRPSDRNRFLKKCFCMPSFITDRTPDIVINLGNCC